MSTNPTTELSPRRAAWFAGISYAVIFVFAIFANFSVRERLVDLDDAAATAANLADNEVLVRIAMLAFLVIFVLDIAVAWLLHVVLRHTGERRSLLAAWFRIGYTVFLGVALVLAFWSPRRAFRATLTAGLGFAAGMGVAALLWMLVDRERPPHHFETHLRTPAEIATCATQPEALVLHKSASKRPSFPSRHGITIGCFVTALFLANRWLGVLAILYGALAAVGRVYVARHFPSDVLVGIVIGSVLAWAIWRLLPPVVSLWGHRHLIEAPLPKSGNGDVDDAAR